MVYHKYFTDIFTHVATTGSPHNGASEWMHVFFVRFKVTVGIDSKLLTAYVMCIVYNSLYTVLEITSFLMLFVDPPFWVEIDNLKIDLYWSFNISHLKNTYIYIYILSFSKTYETFPVEIVSAQAREHLTHGARGAQAQTGARAHARRASEDRRAREVRKQGQDARACARAWARARPSDTRARANKLSKSGFVELICDLESLFARAESLFARALVGPRAHARAHARASWPCLRTSRARASICSRVSRARLSLLAHLARARVKCSRARAAHPAAGEAPYMNSYVLNQANIYIYNRIIYSNIYNII